MKRITLLCFLTAYITIAAHAQQTLEFNRVLMVDTSQVTVPAGKVWKVESALSGQENSLKSYSAFIDGKEIFFGGFKAGDLYWANIESIIIDMRKTNSTSCTQSNTFYLFVEGFENDLPFTKSIYSNATKSAANTTFTNILTLTPQTVGSILEITSVRLYTYRRWGPYELKMTVNYIDGTSQSYTYEYTSTPCSSSGSYTYHMGDSNGPYEIPLRSREKYSLETQLPIWLPAGSTIKAGKNVEFINVIEFNVN